LVEAIDYQDYSWNIPKITVGVLTLGVNSYKHYNDIQYIQDLMSDLKRKIRTKLEEFMNTFEEKHVYHDIYI
jgi:hypothetical protein